MHELIHKTLLNGMGSCQWMLSTLRGVSATIVNKLFCTTSLSKMAQFKVQCPVLCYCVQLYPQLHLTTTVCGFTRKADCSLSLIFPCDCRE